MSDMKEAEAFDRWARERLMTPGMVYWKIAKEAWEAGAAFASAIDCTCPPDHPNRKPAPAQPTEAEMRRLVMEAGWTQGRCGGWWAREDRAFSKALPEAYARVIREKADPA